MKNRHRSVHIWGDSRLKELVVLLLKVQQSQSVSIIVHLKHTHNMASETLQNLEMKQLKQYPVACRLSQFCPDNTKTGLFNHTAYGCILLELFSVKSLP